MSKFLRATAAVLAFLVLPAFFYTPPVALFGTCSIGGNDSFTKVLLHADDGNGATTALDSNRGGVSNTWTAQAGGSETTSQFKFGTGSLGGAVLANAYFAAANNASFGLGSGNFTVDFWFYKLGANGAARGLAGHGSAGPSNIEWGVGLSAANVIYSEWTTGGTLASSTTLTGTTTITTAGWHHFAFVRNGNVFTEYLDGNSEATTTVSQTLFSSSSPLSVGFDAIGTGAFIGYIDEFRLSVGVARWTTNFTPPTAPYC